MIRRDGKLSEVSHQEAYERVAEMLRQAQKPLLYGWASTVCEAQKKGLPGATPGQAKIGPTPKSSAAASRPKAEGAGR